MRNSVAMMWVAAAVVMVLPVSAVFAAGSASDTDKAFQAKVSQGGMYEVEASKVAVTRAMAPDVRDLAVMEVHDHELVGAELKKISLAGGLSFPSALNAEFSARLAKLKAVPAAQFDAAYIADMDAIHDKDEKLFAQESMDGSGDFKGFAGRTDKIVKRHIGALHAF